MKAISVILLVIGVASAVPLKAPRKNLQDLLTQQNFNTVLQQIQLNQDLYQSLISAYPAQFQSVTQWLASQGFALPRLGVSEIKSLFRNLDEENFDFEGFLGSLNVQTLAEIINVQQYFTPEIFKQVLSYVFQYPLYSSIPISFLGSLNINVFQVWSELVAGTFNQQQYLTQQTTDAALIWFAEHPDETIDLALFYLSFLPMDQTITTLIKTVNYLLSNVASFYLGSGQQVGSLNYQQLYQEVLENINYQPYFGEFNIQSFLYSDIAYSILMACVSNIDEAEIPVSFLTSLGVNYFYLVGHLYAGTFDPEQDFSVETIFAALQWADSHPNELPHLVSFLLDYLPNDQVYILMGNTLYNLAPTLMHTIWPNLLNNLPKIL